MPANPSDNMLLVNNGDGRFARYFADLERALRLAEAWARGYTGGSIDGSWHTNYLRGLAACFTMLRSRYTFESNDSILVDLAHSGYPHSYTLSRIASDRAEALAEHLKSELLGVAEYKQVFLDELFSTGSVSATLLNRIACAHYAHVVTMMDAAFDPRFMCGEPTSIELSKKRYRLQWDAFDPTQNLPVLCGMVFEYSGVDLTRALAGLKLVLRHETGAGMSVAALAESIDTGVADIRPLALTRATIGPLHLPGFTSGHDVSSDIPEAHDEVLVEIIVDETHALASKKTSSLAVRFGVVPAERQVYAIRVADPLCYERGAAAVERIIILPHRVLQSMSNEERRKEERLYTFVPYTQQGELQ